MKKTKLFSTLAMTCMAMTCMAMTCMAGEKIAFRNGGDRISRSVATSPILEKGWVAWAHQDGPVLKANGFKRLMIHNPGGQHWWIYPKADNHQEDDARRLAEERGLDTRGMWINQWELCEAAGVKNADRAQLREAVKILQEEYGIEEIIWYVGSPETLRDPYHDGLRCLEPFMLPGCHFAFDHAFTNRRGVKAILYWRDRDDERDARIQELIDFLRAEGRKVYIEARTALGDPVIDGTIAMDRYDAIHPDEVTAGFERGEVIRVNRAKTDPTTWEDSRITPCLYPDMWNWQPEPEPEPVSIYPMESLQVGNRRIFNKWTHDMRGFSKADALAWMADLQVVPPFDKWDWSALSVYATLANAPEKNTENACIVMISPSFALAAKHGFPVTYPGSEQQSAYFRAADGEIIEAEVEIPEINLGDDVSLCKFKEPLPGKIKPWPLLKNVTDFPTQKMWGIDHDFDVRLILLNTQLDTNAWFYTPTTWAAGDMQTRIYSGSGRPAGLALTNGRFAVAGLFWTSSALSKHQTKLAQIGIELAKYGETFELIEVK